MEGNTHTFAVIVSARVVILCCKKKTCRRGYCFALCFLSTLFSCSEWTIPASSCQCHIPYLGPVACAVFGGSGQACYEASHCSVHMSDYDSLNLLCRLCLC